MHEEKRPPAPAPSAEVPSFASRPPPPARPSRPPCPPGRSAPPGVGARRSMRSPASAPPRSWPCPRPTRPPRPRPQLPQARPAQAPRALHPPGCSQDELPGADARHRQGDAGGGAGSPRAPLRAAQLLSQQYNGARGDLTLVELEGVLRAHELMEAMQTRERTAILAAFTEHRGASGRVGWALASAPPSQAARGQGRHLPGGRGAARALPPRGPHRAQPHAEVDLLGREKYLVDLGIKKRFSDMLRREPEVLVRDELPSAESLRASPTRWPASGRPVRASCSAPSSAWGWPRGCASGPRTAPPPPRP